MDVDIPRDMDPDVRADLLGAGEGVQPGAAARRQLARTSGACVGQYSNLSIFDVADNDELHDILWKLPLFPYMKIAVTPLAGHPSDIAVGEVTV